MYGGADHSSSAVADLPTNSFIAKALSMSMKVKDVLFSTLPNKNNIYTCHGLARAYSRRMYEKLQFPVSVGNDMYSFLFCVQNKLTYIYAKNAVVWYRLPQTYADHAKQSKRFYVSAMEQTKYFENKVVERETKIPLSVYLKAAIRSMPILLTAPFYVFSYLVIQFSLRPKSQTYRPSQTWETAITSKTL
jgi:cellulose synthase/poly-beta-1,6-N-acetylglucosamine synthase-like glycosyltransferase